MKEIRGGIVRLFEQGKSGYQIAKDMNLHRGTVNKIIKRYKETGNFEDKPRSGRPRSARTKANKQKIKGRIQRNPNSRKNSLRKMGKVIGIHWTSIRTILKEDLGMKSRKMAKGQLLNEEARNKRLNRCKRYGFCLASKNS